MSCECLDSRRVEANQMSDDRVFLDIMMIMATMMTDHVH